MRISKIIALALVTFVTACGGGGGGSDDAPVQSQVADFDQDTIREIVAQTNIDHSNSTCCYDDSAARQGTNFFNQVIIVRHNNEPRVLKALDDIEAIVGRTLFDRTSHPTTETDALPADATFAVHYADQTAENGAGSCGFAGPRRNYGINADSSMRGLIVVAIKEACKTDHDIIVHEFAHAMGLWGHFRGTGVGGTGAFDKNAKTVLRTLYNNPLNTAEADLQVYREEDALP